MKNYVQKMTCLNGRVHEIRRDYIEMILFMNRLEQYGIDGIENFEQQDTFNFSFDRYGVHYEFYVDGRPSEIFGIQT